MSLFKEPEEKPILNVDARLDKRIYKIVCMINDIRALLWDMKEDGVKIKATDLSDIRELIVEVVNDIRMYNASKEDIEAWLNGDRKQPTKKLK